MKGVRGGRKGMLTVKGIMERGWVTWGGIVGEVGGAFDKNE